MVAGLFSGALASLLATLESEARRGAGRRTHRDDEISAEKKHKKKCKKCKKGKCKPKPNGTPCSGGSCQSGACKPGDEAPPCTDESCPLPPGCSQQAFDDCTAAFIEALQADIEPCRADCEGGDNPAGRACLDPILTARMPDAEVCIVESCTSPARETATYHRAKGKSSPTAARDWWQRRCDNPGCCPRELGECSRGAAADALTCAGVAIVTCFSGPACFAVMAACLAKEIYDAAKCQALYGCEDCLFCCEGDGTCCPIGEFACESGTCCTHGSECCPKPQGGCCREGSHCCEHGGCCNDGDKCCPRSPTGCCPNAQCMPTGIPCCSNC
jgi:hypothetical protein